MMTDSAMDSLESLVLENWDDFARTDEISKTFYNTGGWELDSAIHLVAQTSDVTTVYDLVEEDDLFGWRVDKIFIEFIERLTKLRLNVNKLAFSKVNLLNSPDDSAPWEQRYAHALAQYVSTHGSPCSWGDGYYGWQDYDFSRQNPHLYVVAVLSVKTDSWSEFEDTYSEASNHVGVVGDCVFSDGSQRRMRWEGEPSALIRSITE